MVTIPASSNYQIRMDSSPAGGPASIFDFLLLQPEQHVNDLYRNPWCALAVFQSLDTLSRHVVLRLLFLGRIPISYELLEQFMTPLQQSMAAVRATFNRLKLLRVVGTPPSESGPATAFDMNGASHAEVFFVLHAQFQESLQRAILSPEDSPWAAETRMLPSLRSAPHPSEVEMVRRHARSRVLQSVHALHTIPLCPHHSWCSLRQLAGIRSFIFSSERTTLLLQAPK